MCRTEKMQPDESLYICGAEKIDKNVKAISFRQKLIERIELIKVREAVSLRRCAAG